MSENDEYCKQLQSISRGLEFLLRCRLGAESESLISYALVRSVSDLVDVLIERENQVKE